MSAIDNYKVDASKVKVVPFGANVECDRNIESIYKIIEGKKFDTLKLLFIGVDWYRKGGDKALAVAEMMNEKGYKTELHVVGCTPPFPTPHFVKKHGFISKNNEYGRRKINQLYSESHFFILPSLAECAAVVLAEASSFGLPSITTNVGGITTIIKNDVNGRAFDVNEAPEELCKYIEDIVISKETYRRISISSFMEYSTRLNWQSSGNKVVQLIKDHVY